MHKESEYHRSRILPDDLQAFRDALPGLCDELQGRHGQLAIERRLTYKSAVVTSQRPQEDSETFRTNDEAEFFDLIATLPWTYAHLTIEYILLTDQELRLDGLPYYGVEVGLLRVAEITITAKRKWNRHETNLKVSVQTQTADFIDDVLGWWEPIAEQRREAVPDYEAHAHNNRELLILRSRFSSSTLSRIVDRMKAIAEETSPSETFTTQGGGTIEVQRTEGVIERVQHIDPAGALGDWDDPSMISGNFNVWISSYVAGDDSPTSPPHSANINVSWDGMNSVLSCNSDISGLVNAVVALFEQDREASLERIKPRIFIAHGRSPAWQSLRLNIESLGLEVDFFEAHPRAGFEASDIVLDMIRRCDMAFIVLTAEDQSLTQIEKASVRAEESLSDESTHFAMRARQNVIHELGIAQGILGPTRAIMLVEEGLEIMSNVVSIQQARFRPGGIRDTFDEVRATILREFPFAFDASARPSNSRPAPDGMPTRWGMQMGMQGH